MTAKPSANVRRGAPAAFDWPRLNAQALEESAQPIRPGIPGRAPFWNAYAKQFIYAPAFDFKTFDEADHYQFEVRCQDGTCHEFQAAAPWADLGPVWRQIPVGFAGVKVTARKVSGEPLAIAGLREFYKAAPFSGPTTPPACGFRECAARAFDWLYRLPAIQHWEHKQPDPGYQVYHFPAKMIGAVMDAMLACAALFPERQERALALAMNAADYLIAASYPAGHPLAHLPPVYDFQRLGPRNKFYGKLMLTEACLPFGAYLRLAAATGQRRFREAAVRIADAYARLQLPAGTWPLMVGSDTGEPLMANLCMPLTMIRMFDTLLAEGEREPYRRARDRALAWLLDHPVRDFHWESQFEDIMPESESYKSMTGLYAAQTAQYLMDHADEVPGRDADVRDLMRYAEDQFVVWSKPMPRPGKEAWPILTASWPLPSVLEQYHWYYPIDGSAITMMRMYLAAHARTGQDLFLAKTLALGAAVTASQDPDTGRLSGMWGDVVGYASKLIPWLNCTTYTAQAMLDLEAALRPATVREPS